MSYAIQTESLTKRFVPVRSLLDVVTHPFQKVEPQLAVDGVTLQVNPGEIFGLLGTNGAGKTTLIKLLCTLISPTRGRAFVGGHDVVKEEQQVRASIGLVTCEDRSFYWRLTGKQNLEFYGHLYHLKSGEIRTRMGQLAQLLQLEGILEQRFDSYSSGTKQKIAIARALMHEPGILFMDEPTRSLDPMMIAEFKLFLKKELVERQGKTIVLATHQLQTAEQLCDRIAIMNRGRCVAVGSLEELRLKFGRTRLDLFTNTDVGIDACQTLEPSLERVFVHFAGSQHNTWTNDSIDESANG